MSDSFLGKVFALCTADEQAEFLNEAGKRLRQACRDGNEDMQLFLIGDRLTEDGRRFVLKLAEVF